MPLSETSRTLTLALPYVPSGKLAENARRRLNWGAYAALLAGEREVAYGLILEALGGKRPHFERCTLSIQFTFKRKGQGPDYENLVARQKPLVDVLVQVGVLAGDSWDVVRERQTPCPLTGGIDATIVVVRRVLGIT